MSDVVIPNTSRHDVSTYDILVDEVAVDPSFQVLSISVLKEANKIPIAKITFRDGEAADRTFAISNEAFFIPGKKIKIKIGRDGNNTQVFKGIITKHAIKVRENGNSELNVECKDEAVKMTIGRKNKYYENVKDSDVFDELIKGYAGLSINADPTTLKHKEIVQHYITDWDFLLLRAEANGMLVFVNDGQIKVVKPNTKSAEVMQVTYGSSLLEFEAEMDARNQWKSVRARSWDYATQKLFESDASSVPFDEPGNISGSTLAGTINLAQFDMHHSGHRLEQELQDWAKGFLLRSRLGKIRGRAKILGSTDAKPGDMVMLAGVGDRFNGKAYTTAVRHDISTGSWDTHLQFGLDPEMYSQKNKDMHDPATGGLIGSIQGLQIGKVVQLENDPDGEHRILVKIPVIDNNAHGVWTRVASLDAGSDRGAFFRPELEDEVIVGFINNDPRDAVVLGMLHSSAKPAPITAKNVNHEKGFTTRSKMHISFNDDKKTIKIDTPAGNYITLDESAQKIELKDQNKNVITMDATGITIESPKQVTIKAGTNLTLEAALQFAIKATSLSAKAQADVTVEGNASAKVSSSGMTTVKGSLVMIN
ncbi:MAG TPA: type VI secretion system tip protein VgrG [Chitinophagaceae bacterium]|nr:type VI secretion system tip protein VgrG [Chitinophagaceae bacterium]